MFKQAKETVRMHCDPQRGARYWIERAGDRGIDVEQHINGWDDLHLFGWMDEDAMRSRPIADFIPTAFMADCPGIFLAETSGFMGAPKTAVFSSEEFLRAFVTPFEIAAEAARFPSKGHWLWIGPGGPHPIGRAARTIARRHGPGDPFSVDFDPRWFNKLAPGSFARTRYLDHVIDQSIRILDREPIDILFTTPAVLERLAEAMSNVMRERVRGVHYGGQSLGDQRMRRFEEEWFGSAVHLAGYGNSMFGVCMEISREIGRAPRYFPHGVRIKIDVIDPTATADVPPGSFELVPIGERGRVVFHRFDRSMMILNMLERDEAIRIEPESDQRALGFVGDGIENPDLARELRDGKSEGIY